MRAVARAASVASVALALVLGVDRLFAPPDLVMAVLAACAAGAAAAFSIRTLWPLRRGPSAGRVARYVEERCTELQDRLASTIDLGEPRSSFGSRVLDDAEESGAAMAIRLLPTCCRKSEIFNLYWNYVDLAAREMWLPDT